MIHMSVPNRNRNESSLISIRKISSRSDSEILPQWERLSRFSRKAEFVTHETFCHFHFMGHFLFPFISILSVPYCDQNFSPLPTKFLGGIYVTQLISATKSFSYIHNLNLK